MERAVSKKNSLTNGLKMALLATVANVSVLPIHAFAQASTTAQPTPGVTSPTDSAAQLPSPPSAEEMVTGDQPDADIVVTGFRGSVASALEAKRKDVRVTDGISAEDIGKFPSENIAEAIQRISGVQMTNINGRGSTISIRGLGPQYANTTLNGQTLKSADFTDGFRYDIIQTDLATAIQVIKSPIANMDAGGLSGTVNINTVMPLDYRDRRMTLSVKGQKSETADGGVTPKISGSYLDQFLDNTLGVYVNVGYQKLRDRADYAWMDRWFTTNTADGVLYTPRRPRFRRIDRDTERLLFNGGAQWKPSDTLEFGLVGLYAKDKTDYDVNQQVFLFSQAGITAEQVDNLTATKITARNFTLENNRQAEKRNLSTEAYTATAKWENDGWRAKLTGHFTRGKSYVREDAAILGITMDAVSLDISDPKNVKFTSANDLNDAAWYDPFKMTRNEYPNGATRLLSSAERSGQLDLSRDLNWGPLQSVDIGAKYRHEDFNRYVTRHDRAVIGNAAPNAVPRLTESSYSVTNFLDGRSMFPSGWIAPDLASYQAALEREGVVIADQFSPESSYTVDRFMPSVYAMANVETNMFSIPVRGNVGVRYEHTRQDVGGYLTRDIPGAEVDQAIGTFKTRSSYGNVLPSASLIFDVSSRILVRAAVAKVLVRPILDGNASLATIASSSANSEGSTTNVISLSQADLKPLTANQADLGIEYNDRSGNGVSINGFYKDVKNGTFSSLICPANYSGTPLAINGAGECADAAGNFYDITQTLNDGSTVTIKGYEVAVSQSFDRFLPVKGFGFTGNYTRVIPEKVEEGQGYRVRNLSKVTWNATAYWEDDLFSIRGSVNHRSAYEQASADSFFAREGHTIRPRTQYDLALGFAPTKYLNFAGGIINLTNATEEAYKDLEDRWQMTSVTGRSFYLSATLRM